MIDNPDTDPKTMIPRSAYQELARENEALVKVLEVYADPHFNWRVGLPHLLAQTALENRVKKGVRPDEG